MPRRSAVAPPQPDRHPHRGALPSNIEAETFVLGCVLLDHTRFGVVAEHLEARDFVTGKHRTIFTGMQQLHEKGMPIEEMTLREQLRTGRKLTRAGGIAYIARLTLGMPRVDHLEKYARIVREKSILRQLIQAVETIDAECRDASESVEEILAESERKVLAVGNLLLRSGGLESPAETLAGFAGGRGAFLDPRRRPRGLSSPFHRFDALTGGMRKGQLIVLAGRPAMGKTAMALNIAAHVAAAGDGGTPRTVALFSLEMSREELLTRLVCAEAHVDQRQFRRGFLGEDGRARLDRALDRLVDSRLFIDDTASLNLLELSVKCRRLQSEQGLDLVVIDYLQLLGSRGRVENRVQEVSAFSRGLKLLAKDLDVPVLALSQLSRAPENPRRKNRRPLLSDLRDSGSIEQDADVVCFVYREEAYNPEDRTVQGTGELIIGKQRNGPIGTVKLAFLKKFAKFENLEAHVRDDESEPVPAPF